METSLGKLNKQIKNAFAAEAFDYLNFGPDLAGINQAYDHHYLDVADPNEVVQYILQQPNHTWMGITIWPDEAWRYSGKSDWMWWRE